MRYRSNNRADRGTAEVRGKSHRISSAAKGLRAAAAVGKLFGRPGLFPNRYILIIFVNGSQHLEPRRKVARLHRALHRFREPPPA